jgi:antagonist of KipI
VSVRPLLRVLSGGPQTTVQDLGRPGAQPLGVPAGGAADPVALRLANRLADNSRTAAGLEITLGGFEAEFLAEAAAGLAGADLGLTLDGLSLAPGSAFRARAGSRLRSGGRRWGCRAYLSVGGGFAVPEVLGSRSTYLPAAFGGFQGRALRAGDVLEGPGGIAQGFDPGARTPAGLAPPYPGPGDVLELRAVRGPQDDAFTQAGLRTFFSAAYEVSAEADRMGCRLRGPRIEHRRSADIVSEAVAWGSVQVPGNGEPIVLMADRQTTGGYAKIATVATVDLPLLAQAVPGDGVRFREVSLWEAREALLWREHRMRQWEREP